MHDPNQLAEDERLARELQREELNGLYPNQISQPLLNHNQNNQNVNLRGNVAQGLYEASSYRLVMFYCLYGLIEMIATACVLAIDWNTQCNRHLNLWILIFSSRFVLVIPLQIYRYRANRALRYEIVDDTTKLLNWINIITFLWFIVGQSWIYGVHDCKHSALYIYCLIVISVIYFGLLLPIIIVISICLCTPCILVIFQYIGADSSTGAQQADISRLPTRNLTECPEDPCSICQEEYEVGDEVRDLPCEHYFHSACIDRWLYIQKKCPLCRHDITAEVPSRPEQNA
jgi:hypothetical protein